MVETIAGSRKRARKFLNEFLSPEERKAALEKESGGVQLAIKELLK
jgi:hypothetical protein